MMTDPISDMLTRIRNASMVSKTKVDLPMSKVKFAIAKILEQENYISNVEVKTIGNRTYLSLTLKYSNKTPVITNVKRISKPGRRVYIKSGDIKNIRFGLGMSIISTPNGLMTNNEARKRHLGGEVICEVY